MHLRKINPSFILFYILYLTHTIFPLFNYIQPTGELPSDWTAYMDTDGNIPYYYNSRTGENTYDHPLATVMKEQVIASREASKQGDEAWSRGTVADYWLAFGGESVTSTIYVLVKLFVHHHILLEKPHKLLLKL